MEYFEIILKEFTTIFLFIVLYFLLKNLNSKNINHINYTVDKEVFLAKQDLKEMIKETINKEREILKKMNKYLTKVEQDKISWINTKKKLPPVGEMIILLKDCTHENRGYLEESKKKWIIPSLPKKMQEIPLEKISHWKPIFYL